MLTHVVLLLLLRLHSVVHLSVHLGAIDWEPHCHLRVGQPHVERRRALPFSEFISSQQERKENVSPEKIKEGITF